MAQVWAGDIAHAKPRATLLRTWSATMDRPTRMPMAGLGPARVYDYRTVVVKARVVSALRRR
jgi:hypothetical protein